MSSMPFTIALGLVLLAAGLLAAFRSARTVPDSPPATWQPDPAADGAQRQRWWDGQTWTPRISDGAAATTLGHRFRGRFWGSWVWLVVGGAIVFAIGVPTYLATDSALVLAVTSGVSMAFVGAAFYRFVDRQVHLHEAIGLAPVVAVVVGGAGAATAIALTANQLLIDSIGTDWATHTVGLVEEGTKLLVPLVLWWAGRYRSPRAGIALGLASGIGFAIVEAAAYGWQLPHGSGPQLCGVDPSEPSTIAFMQAYRVVAVEPMHWLWTGIAVTVAWRLWHLRGRAGTPLAVLTILAVMVVHSANDSSITGSCDDAGASGLLQWLRIVLVVVCYLWLKAMMRKSTPPDQIGVVSRGWVPKRLGAEPSATPAVGADRPDGDSPRR